jgi:4-amino-4-deoxy-L-arabinose transferase-like glycosyltransferase
MSFPGRALPGRALPRLVRLRPWHVALLMLLGLALYLPGQATLPPMDRDEARYAQATRQMLESGDFIDIRFQDEARYKKPVGIYWLQSVSAGWLAGPEHDGIWAYRMPSLLAAVGALLLTACSAPPPARSPR